MFNCKMPCNTVFYKIVFYIKSVFIYSLSECTGGSSQVLEPTFQHIHHIITSTFKKILILNFCWCITGCFLSSVGYTIAALSLTVTKYEGAIMSLILLAHLNMITGFLPISPFKKRSVSNIFQYFFIIVWICLELLEYLVTKDNQIFFFLFLFLFSLFIFKQSVLFILIALHYALWSQ